jgi:histidinol-phosphate aminotransferase
VTRTLVIGGTRSGKSAHAEALLVGAADVTYVATGSGDGDAEMAARIARHRARRPAAWTTVETLDVGDAIARAAGPVLVDSVGLWVAGMMDAGGLWEAGDLDGLAAAARRWFDDAGRDVVVVAEHVGAGVVAEGSGTRRWVDAVGEVTAVLSELADRAVLVVGGRALPLPAPTGPVDRAASGGDGGTGEGRADPVGTPRPGTADAEVEVSALALHGDVMVPDGVVDLAVNVLADRPPKHVQQALARVDESRYPDQAEALAAVSALVGVAEDHVVLLAGAAEAFWLLPHAIRPAHAAIVHPTFTAGEAALRACEVPVTRVPRDAADGWRLRPDRVPDDADLVLLGNPNNPTGTLDDPAAIASLCRPGRTVVVDEAFMDFVIDGRSSLAGRVDLPGLVVLRSVTKLWSVPGLRAGYLVAARGLARRLRRHQQPWPVPSRALAAIAAACDDEAWRVQTAEGVARRRRAMARRLGRIPGVVVHEGAANFVLVEVASGPAVHKALLARGVAVRPSTFPLLPPRYLRVAVRDASATEQLAQALEAVL